MWRRSLITAPLHGWAAVWPEHEKEATMTMLRTRSSRSAALVFALCIALLLAGMGTREALAADGNNHAQRLGQEFCDAWTSHDADRVVALFTENAVYEDVPFGLKATGSELQTFAQDFFLAVPDVRVECVSIEERGGHGSIEWVFSGTDVGIFKTGKPFSLRAASVFDSRGGKITRNVDYYDAATFMRQVGVLP